MSLRFALPLALFPLLVGPANAADPAMRCLRTADAEYLLMSEPCPTAIVAIRPERDWRHGVRLEADGDNRAACWRDAGSHFELLVDGLTQPVPAALPEPLRNCPAYRRQREAVGWEWSIARCEDIDQPPESRRPDCLAALSVAGGFAEDDPRRVRTLEAAAMAAPTLAEEERLVREALALRERHHPDDAQAMVVTIASLAVVRQRAGDRDDAIRHYRRALELGDRRLGAGNIEVTVWRLTFGAILENWGLKDEAEQAWRTCVEAPRPESDRRRLNALHYAGFCADRLARLYDAAGRPDDARRARVQAEALRAPLREFPAGGPRYAPEPDSDDDPG